MRFKRAVLFDKLRFSAPKVRSSIRLRRVILLRSDIRLTTSDIRYASFLANRISLKPQALISLSHKRQYHSAFAEYHYFYLTDKSKFDGDKHIKKDFRFVGSPFCVMRYALLFRPLFSALRDWIFP